MILQAAPVWRVAAYVVAVAGIVVAIVFAVMLSVRVLSTAFARPRIRRGAAAFAAGVIVLYGADIAPRWRVSDGRQDANLKR